MLVYPHLLKTLPTALQRAPASGSTFWRWLVERVATGEAPFGTWLRNHALGFQKESLSLTDAGAIDVLTFFETVVGLQLEFVAYDSWKEIKRKVIRDNLIQEFALRAQREHTLSVTETQRLISLVHLYVTIKKILPQEIQLTTHPTQHHMYIESIDGLRFQQQQVVYVALEDRSVDSTDSDTDAFGGEEDDDSIISQTGPLSDEEEDDSTE
jgi:hypothetical protein